MTCYVLRDKCCAYVFKTRDCMCSGCSESSPGSPVEAEGGLASLESDLLGPGLVRAMSVDILTSNYKAPEVPAASDTHAMIRGVCDGVQHMLIMPPGVLAILGIFTPLRVRPCTQMLMMYHMRIHKRLLKLRCRYNEKVDVWSVGCVLGETRPIHILLHFLSTQVSDSITSSLSSCIQVVILISF